MAGKQMASDGLPASLAGMSKNQLYDIMCQMKTLIQQNQQQARQILIQNPVLTKALFQAQIILGMVQPPQAPAPSQSSQPSSSLIEQPHTQATPSLPSQSGLQEQTRKPQLTGPATAVSSASLSATDPPLPAFPSHQVQQYNKVRGATQMPLPQQSSQIPSNTMLPQHSAPRPTSHLQPPMVFASNQLQQPVQASTTSHMPLQPQQTTQPQHPMPFPHPGHSQVPNMGFQPSGLPPPHHSQPVYHLGTKPPAIQGGQPPIPLQPPARPSYQVGGSHVGQEFHQAGSSSQLDRGSPWIPGHQENTAPPKLSGPLPFPSHMGPVAQPSQPPLLSRDMEKALLEQVMNLTPDQINRLPPEQRNQVMQLREMIIHRDQ